MDKVDQFQSTTMGIDLYYNMSLPPSRAVLLTAKSVGLNLNLKPIDLMKGEHMTPEFLKLNPQHIIPTLNDNGFILWESRAICGYLVNKYAKNDSLYPKQPKARALVDHRLNFDIGTLYHAFEEYYIGVMFGGEEFDPKKKQQLEDAFSILDKLLKGQIWAAGENNMTIADICLGATVSTLDIIGHDLTPYPNVVLWFNRFKKAAPGYKELNEDGCIAFKKLYDHLVKK